MDVESCVSNVVSGANAGFEGEEEATPLVGVYEVHNADDSPTGGGDGDSNSNAGGSSPASARAHSQADPFGDNPLKRRVFDQEQSGILERFYENGMNSTHRRNKELVEDAAREVGVSPDKVKNWIGAETVRRKRQALVSVGAKTTVSSTPPAKRKRSMSGYSLFLSEAMKDNMDTSLEHKTDIATRWRNMSDEDRLEWHQRARVAETHKNGADASPTSPAPAATVSTTVEGRDRIVSYAVSLLQSCLERLDQVGVHSYCLLVDPIQMKTHTLASALGQQFHQQQQQQQQLSQQGETDASSSADGNTEAGVASATEPDQAEDVASPATERSASSVAETLSVYTAFSRFVLSSALTNQAGQASATSTPGAETSTPLGLAAAVTSPTGNACRHQTADGFICPYIATSPHFLRAHRQDTGHHAKRGRPRKHPMPTLGVLPPTTTLMTIPNLNLDAGTSMASLTSALSVGVNAITTTADLTSDMGAVGQDVSDLSVDHMVMLVRNTFNAKYEAITGVKSVPYDDARSLENVVIYGLPESVSLQRPKSYTPDQLRAIVKELGRVVFLPIPKTNAANGGFVSTSAATGGGGDEAVSSFATSVASLISDAVP